MKENIENIEYIYIDAKGKTFEEVAGIPKKDNKISNLKNIKKK